MTTAQEYLGSTKWVERMKQSFILMDRNKNGYVSEEDYMFWVDSLKAINPDPAQDIEKLRATCSKLSAAIGAKPGVQLSQEEYLKGVAEFAANEAECRKLLDEMGEAYYAVMDINKDGKLSLEEYTKVAVAGNMSAEAAKFFFDAMDKNHSGKIEVKEVIAMGHKFWFDRDGDEHQELGKLQDKK